MHVGGQTCRASGTLQDANLATASGENLIDCSHELELHVIWSERMMKINVAVDFNYGIFDRAHGSG
jgi:hypothetical protein